MAEIMTDTAPKSSAALPQPDYAALHTWDNYSAQLLVEYEQCVDEGREMSGLKDVFEVVSHLPESHEKAQLADILHRMAMAAPVRAGYAYDEPTGYDAIQSRCAHWTPRKVPADQALREKVRGAWYGRISGCLLGKPIERVLMRPFAKVRQGLLFRLCSAGVSAVNAPRSPADHAAACMHEPRPAESSVFSASIPEKSPSAENRKYAPRHHG